MQKENSQGSSAARLESSNAPLRRRKGFRRETYNSPHHNAGGAMDALPLAFGLQIIDASTSAPSWTQSRKPILCVQHHER